MPGRTAWGAISTGGLLAKPVPHCCQTTASAPPAKSSPSLATNVVRCSSGSPDGWLEVGVQGKRGWRSSRTFKEVSVANGTAFKPMPPKPW